MEPEIVNLDGIEPRRVEVGHLRADWYDASRAAGSVDVGMRRIRIDPGFFSTPLHVHRSDEEIFYVLGGSGLSVQDDKTYAVRPGDCIVHREAAEAHTLKAGDGGLDVLVFGATREVGFGAYLPRPGVMWARPKWIEVGAGDSPFEREAALGAPDTPEPGERPSSIVNVEDAPSHAGERENFRGTHRMLGRPAGAKRAGFNHVTVEPGQQAWPLHCHSAEEELFVVLEGSGTLLLGEEEHPVRALDVVARPAGTGVSHAFRAGAPGLTYLAYGVRAPNDICYYPRSNKIAFWGVGVITRLEKLDYWDGED